jgi:hypothetical protein
MLSNCRCGADNLLHHAHALSSCIWAETLIRHALVYFGLLVCLS